MTIEKFSGSFSNQSLGCTILLTSTIQSIKNPALLGLYAYLSSKPNNWNIHYREIMNHFGISKKIAYDLLNGLIHRNLLKRTEIREKGRFAKYCYTLFLDGNGLNTDFPPLPPTPEPVPPETVLGETYKTENIQSIELTSLERKAEPSEIKYREANYLPLDHPLNSEQMIKDKKLSDESFDIFFKSYPIQKSENRARCIWYSQRCWEIFEDIMTGLENQIAEDAHFRDGYPPSPDNYILNERWKDKPFKRPITTGTSVNLNQNDWALDIEKDLF